MARAEPELRPCTMRSGHLPANGHLNFQAARVDLRLTSLGRPSQAPMPFCRCTFSTLLFMTLEK